MLILGITGFIGSGKTTAARHLIERHGFTRARWAGALKEMFRTFLLYRGVSVEVADRMIDGDLKEAPSLHINGVTPRVFMERLGTDFGRKCVHPDLWVDTEFAHLAYHDHERVVVEDCRYPNEAEAVRNAGGKVIRTSRPGVTPKDHGTERAQLGIVPDLYVLNEEGRPDVMLRQLDHIVATMEAAHRAGSNSLGLAQ